MCLGGILSDVALFMGQSVRVRKGRPKKDDHVAGEVREKRGGTKAKGRKENVCVGGYTGFSRCPLTVRVLI